MNSALADRAAIRAALGSHRKALWAVALFSAAINFLFLTPSLYMLQVYDRVLASRSEVTLIMLSLVVVGLYIIMGLLEWVRGRILVRVGNSLDLQLAPRIFTATFERNLQERSGFAAGSAMSDLANLRQFITGNGLFAMMDAPWIIIYVLALYMFHPMFGVATTIGVILLLFLAWATEVVSRQPLAEANRAGVMGNAFSTNSLRNAEVIEAMGMLGPLRQRWQGFQNTLLLRQSEASDRAGAISATTRIVRVGLQSAMLGLGALLVIENEMTGGMMIAGAILSGRALAPVELLIGTWKQFIVARGAYQRLQELLQRFPERETGLPLPRPRGQLRVEGVIAVPPGSQTTVLKNVSLSLEPGEVLSILGPSASGKSTLARLLVGVWPAKVGTVRLDGADLYRWRKDELGPWIGYLPQDIELFEGTVAENIARFGAQDSEQIISAAQKAGIHDMVLRFPAGYDTPIGEAGSALSGGQRQRIALARALYGNPSLLVLDEPNASLDDAGEAALLRTIAQLRDEGRTVVLITHRTNLIDVSDKLLLMRDGQVVMQGPRAEVIEALNKSRATAQRIPATANSA
ncbi:MAG TPA: type I secretion system permease/ATPase [Solimonas sp.]|nr:type I secretion system permease/ATPase [Solimonas sp.]